MRLALVFVILVLAAGAAVADVWSAPVNVSQNGLYNRWASVFGDSDGWHYSYMQGDQSNNATWRMYYRTQAFNGVWGAPVQIGNVARSEESRNSRFSDGTHFMVFQGIGSGGPYEFLFSQNSGGGWSAPVYFTPDDGSNDCSTDNERIFDLGSDDTIHMLSQHYNGSQYNMRYYTRTRAGVVTDHGDVYPSGDYQINSAVKVTGSGASERVHFLVCGGASVGKWRCYYRRWNNPGWGPLINLTSLLPISPNGAGSGGIVQLPDGRLVACMSANDSNAGGSWDIWLIFSGDNGDTWGSPINVSTTPGISRGPAVTLNSDGDIVVAWEDDSTGKWQIMARRWRAGRLGRAWIVSDQSTSNFTVSAASHGTTSRLAWHSYVGDNWEITTSENTGVDATAPGRVTQFAASASDGRIYLSWRNPADPDVVGTVIRCKTTGYPAGPADGDLVCDRPGNPNSTDSFVHTGVTNGTTYYYSAFAYDIAPNYSSASSASAAPGSVSCGYVRQLPESTPVDLHSKIVTAVFSSDGAIYVCDQDRSGGIRVAWSGTGIAVGDMVSVSGKVTTRMVSGYAAERVITNATVTRTGSGAVRPIAMGCRAVGGAAIAPNVPGVRDSAGANNMGLLVKIAGRVTKVLGTYIFVDDGSHVANVSGSGAEVGVMVRCPSTPAVIEGDTVTATGIVEGSIPTGWTTNRSYIRLRVANDLTKVR